MLKRTAESASSLSSSDVERYSIDGSSKLASVVPNVELGLKKSNEKWSPKNARNLSTEQQEMSHLSSTSTQLQPERVITFKEENEQNYIQRTVEPNSLPDAVNPTCSCSAAAQQFAFEMRSSKRRRGSLNGQPVSNVPEQQPQPKKKYFEGCLVMARESKINSRFLPGMIRKASADEDGYPDYTCNLDGKTWYFVQFYMNPTTAYWRAFRDLRVYNTLAPKQYLWTHREPSILKKIENGMKIIQAASNFSIEDRLANFTLPIKASTAGLLKKSNQWNSQCAPTDNSVFENGDRLAHPTRGKKTCITDVAANLKKKGAKVLQKKDQEKEKLEKAEATIRDLNRKLQSKTYENGKIARLEKMLKQKDRLIAERDEELKKMRSEVESLQTLFDDE